MQKKWSKKFHNLYNNLFDYLDYRKFILIIIFFTIIKIIFSFIFGDKMLVEEWEIIVNNILTNQILGYHTIDKEVVPSAYMPPLYVYFVYLIVSFGLSELLSVKIILLIQCIFSFISGIYFFKLLKLYFKEKICLVISLAYFFYPLNFYSASQISSVSLQVSFFIFFLYFYLTTETFKDFIILGIFSSFMVLIRGEFWLLLIFLILLKFLNKKIIIKNYLIYLLTMLILISPTIVRNYIHFDTFIITKSSGYNLWRGNSKAFLVNGEVDDSGEILIHKYELKNKLIEEKQIKKYEIILDNYYFDLALKNINQDPNAYIIHYIKKFFSFMVFNPYSDYENYFHPLVVIPEILVSLFAVIGIIKNIFSKERNLEVLMITLYYLFLIPVFFVLPRYKLFILPLYFILIGHLFTFLSKSSFSKKQ